MADSSVPAQRATLFTATLAREQRAVCGFIRGLLGDAEQARDITQDVFLFAWRAAEVGSPPFQLGGDERAVRRWLYCVAYRRAVSALRHQDIVSFERLADSDDIQIGRLGAQKPFEDAVAERETLSAALIAVGPDDAACLLLNVVQGFTAREIATMLEITPDAAKKRLTRAKQRLRDAYYAHETPPTKEVSR